MKKTSMQTLPKTLNILIVTAWVVSELLNAPAFLSDTTVGRPEVDQEHLKPYGKSEKGDISLGY